MVASDKSFDHQGFSVHLERSLWRGGCLSVGGDQRRGRGAAWRRHHVLKTTVLHESPLIHDGHVGGHAARESEVVSDEQQCEGATIHQALQQSDDLLLNDWIESRRRLVGDQQGRIAGQSHGESYPLLFAAAELMGVAMDKPLFESNFGEQGVSYRTCRSPIQAAVQADQLDELIPHLHHGIQTGPRILKDRGDFRSESTTQDAGLEPQQIDAVPENAATDRGSRRMQPRDRSGDGRLAATRGADKCQSAPSIESQVQVRDGIGPTTCEANTQIDQVEH